MQMIARSQILFAVIWSFTMVLQQSPRFWGDFAAVQSCQQKFQVATRCLWSSMPGFHVIMVSKQSIPSHSMSRLQHKPGHRPHRTQLQNHPQLVGL